MELDAKIYIAGHRGLVGSAIVRNLQERGFANLLTRTHADLDLTNQAATAVSKLQSVLQSEKGKLEAVIYSLADGVITVGLNNQLVVYNPVRTNKNFEKL